MRNTKLRVCVPAFRRFAFCVVCSCVLASHFMSHSILPRAAASEEKPIETSNNEEDFNEDELVQETINARRGDREEQGIRDQWLSDEHLGEESTYDSRQPISAKVQRLLEAYRLECKGCDQNQAVRKINAFIKETKRLAEEERKARERRDSWVRKFFAALVMIGGSYAYMNRENLGLEFLFAKGHDNNNDDDLQGFSEAQRANIMRLRRQQAADAATQRQQQDKQAKADPSWLENEQKKIWTPKQEKQFQKALREFSGVPKKERYKLIAERVNGKAWIECLLHHKMLEFLAKRAQEEGQ